MPDLHPPAKTFSFSTKPMPRLVYGLGSLNSIGELCDELLIEGLRSVLIVTDPGIAKTGHVERALSAISKENIQVHVYDRVQENPSESSVQECLDFVHGLKNEIGLIIGLGGGSSMDTAKGLNFLLTNGGCMENYLGYGKAQKSMLPFIAIPTTAGTGSECQSFALITNEKTHLKMACGDSKVMAVAAVLDPELTVTMPEDVMKCTGIDAITHALETLVSKRSHPYSRHFSKEAFRLLIENFAKIQDDPGDIHARGEMLLGAAYAGLAIENSMLGCAHSCANPLTAKFDVTHGRAVGVFMSHVMRHNAEDGGVSCMYGSLARYAGLCERGMDNKEAVETLILHVENLCKCVSLELEAQETCKKKSQFLDVDIQEMAKMAADQWTAQFNPVTFSHEDFVSIYKKALG
ncbi:MAG: iron-containing alcohol dehydrogenase [Verrucomicrobiota bacterium]